ncbi:Rho GTPase-activating protein [Entamoeba marina]
MAKPMFGVLLEEVPTVNGVPLPVYELISYLTERPVRLEVEGIFRISGKLSDITIIKEMYNKREYVDLSKYDIHTVAAVLKAFFRELPDSLVTHENTDMIIATVQMDEKFHPTKVKNIQNILSFLPTIYYETLRLLILYLKQISDHSNINKMTTSNIAMIFGVNIFTGVGVVDILSKENTACFTSTGFLIDNCHEIFSTQHGNAFKTSAQKQKPTPVNPKKQPLIGRSPPSSPDVKPSSTNTAFHKKSQSGSSVVSSFSSTPKSVPTKPIPAVPTKPVPATPITHQNPTNGRPLPTAPTKKQHRDLPQTPIKQTPPTLPPKKYSEKKSNKYFIIRVNMLCELINFFLIYFS